MQGGGEVGRCGLPVVARCELGDLCRQPAENAVRVTTSTAGIVVDLFTIAPKVRPRASVVPIERSDMQRAEGRKRKVPHHEPGHRQHQGHRRGPATVLPTADTSTATRP